MPYRRVLNYTGISASNGPDPLFNQIDVNDFPAMAVDKSTGPHRGRIYVVLPIKENGNGKAVIGFTFSDNQGGTWSAPTTISIPTGRQNFFPWITVDDCSGDVWVTYYSFDTPSGFTTNTYVAHSTDGGATWESQKVSDVGYITAPINDNIFRKGYAGDYIGITAFGGRAYPIWMDNRNGTWQLYCSPVTSNISSYSISGDASFCTTSKPYTIPGLPTGATVTWSASPFGIVQINSPNSNSTTLTNISSGVITLTATINNTCGTYQVSTQVTVGNPLTGTINQGGILTPMYTVNSISAGPTSVSFQWPGVSGISCYQSSSNPPVSQTGFIYYAYNNSFWFTLSAGQSITVNFSGTGCSGTTIATRSFTVSGHHYIVTPNPATNTFTISPNTQSGNPKTLNAQESSGGIRLVTITDVTGVVRQSQSFAGNTNTVQMNVSNLPRGNYFVEISDGNHIETLQLLINK